MPFIENLSMVMLCFPSGKIILEPYILHSFYETFNYCTQYCYCKAGLMICEELPSDDLFSHALTILFKKMLQLVHFLLSQFR